MINNFAEDRCQSRPALGKGGLEVSFVFWQAFCCLGVKQE